MGQAKRRGSFEERKAQAQARDHERREHERERLQQESELKERKRQEAQERFDARPQEEKDALIALARRRRSVAPFLLFALGLSLLD